MNLSVEGSAYGCLDPRFQTQSLPKVGFTSVKLRKLSGALRAAPTGTPQDQKPCNTIKRPDVDAVRYVSKPDVAFLLSEIYDKEVYLQHGISLLPGDTVLDIGANIGLFAHYAAQRVGAAGRVIACEPIPPVYGAAEANVAALHTSGAALKTYQLLRAHACACML